VADLVGQDAGHLGRISGVLDQAAEQHHAPAGQRKSIRHLDVEHVDPEAVGRGGLGGRGPRKAPRQARGQAVERGAAGRGLAKLGRVPLDRREDLA
jgi:hypothetical protein